MKIEAHLLAFNEERILPFALRHYQTFCTQIVLHDLGSQDKTMQIAREFGCEIRSHDAKGEFDDRLNKSIKQESWKTSDADWIIQADSDELLYFPAGAKASFDCYESQQLAVVKPYGYEMTSDIYPTGKTQIYDEVKLGGRDDRWYAKPILFNAKRCHHLEFSTGAHTCEVQLKNGRQLGNIIVPSSPSCFLLHFHHIGPLEEIAKRYDENFARQSAINHRMGWGNQETGIKHATDKRNLIRAHLERVIV